MKQDSLITIIFGTLIGLLLIAVVWPGSLFTFGCDTSLSSSNNTCGERLPEMTSIPTLRAATMPAPKVGAEAAAARPTCHIAAVNLIGAWVEGGASETEAFSFTDAKGVQCTGTFKDDVQKLFITPNLWFAGAPACITCHYADVKKATMNMDLSSYTGIIAGSHRANGEPKGNDILGGGNWDDALLHKMLYAPDGKTQIGRPPMPFGRPATVPADGPVISAGIPGGNGTAAGPTEATVEIARPSNPGDAGDAVKLTGDPASGAVIFESNCVRCHNTEGKGGITNLGSSDGTVPPLNPIDSTLVNTDSKVFAYNLDLFIEHGSTPEGNNPSLKMPAWGDDKKLSPQQIADTIAYLISLNAASPGESESSTSAVENTPAPTEPVEDIARPSNPGGAGLAITLTGNILSGKQLFATNCVACHNIEGKGGIPNPGSDDGTVPTLNPIDPTLVSEDSKVFSYNLDLFLEHGSTPEGDNPSLKMPAWGDDKNLSPQNIADLIAYLMSLNSTQTPLATPTP